MGSAPLAFSVHHFINSVGSDAGFASIIGLAILVLLYFAQARETATLRDHAYEAAQRIQQLEGRLAQLARQPAVPQQVHAPPAPATAPPPAIAAAAAQAARPVAAAVPAAPAGMAAPALAAATKLIPTPAHAAPSAVPEPVLAGAQNPADATAVASPPPATAAPTPATAAPTPATAAPTPATAAPTPATAAPTPATAAGGANGASHDRVPSPAAAPRFTSPPPRVQTRPGPPPSPPRRPLLGPRGSAPGRGAPPGRTQAAPPRRVPRVIPILLVALVLAGGVAGLLVATSGGGTQASTNSSPTTNVAATHHAKRPAKFDATAVTVAVLNGTATSGLAHRVAAHLTAAGYKQGSVATAADQTRTATTVSYLPEDRNDALHVASALKLGTGAVQQIDSSTQAVACPPPGTCAAQVVVTVGSDLAGVY